MKATCPACGAATVVTSLLLPCEQCKRVFQPRARDVAWLAFEPREEGRVALLRGESVIVGRDPSAEVRIVGPFAARIHAQFTRQPDGHWHALDLRSSGGTYINKKRIPSGDRGTPGQLLHSGEELHPLRLAYFNAFVPVVEHSDALDENVTEPSAWEVWTDSLLERGEPLGHWMREPEHEMHERTAFIGAFVTPFDSRAALWWNQHGFVEHARISEELLWERPWFGDPLRAPGLQYLSKLQLEVSEPQLARCFDVLSAIPLPRSLRHITGIAVPPELRQRWSDLLLTLRARCPWLRANE